MPIFTLLLPYRVDRRTCKTGISGCFCQVEKLLGFGRGHGTWFSAVTSWRALAYTLLLWCKSENILDYKVGNIFAGVLCDKVAISSWVLLLRVLPWHSANVLWQQIKLQLSLRLAAAFSGWCCCRVRCLRGARWQQGVVYLHAGMQIWIKVGNTTSCVPAKPGQSTVRCVRCDVLLSGVRLFPWALQYPALRDLGAKSFVLKSCGA